MNGRSSLTVGSDHYREFAKQLIRGKHSTDFAASID